VSVSKGEYEPRANSNENIRDI